MTPETIGKIFSGLFSSGWVSEQLYVAWHGGEPLVLPPDYYEQAFGLIADLAPAGVEVEHAFQTNGMFIDDRWCEFFKRHGASVGVSIDGPEHIHDKNRIARSGTGTFSQVIKEIRLPAAKWHSFQCYNRAECVVASLSQRNARFLSKRGDHRCLLQHRGD